MKGLLVVQAFSLYTLTLQAQSYKPIFTQPGAIPNTAAQEKLLKHVGIDQKLDSQVPLDTAFRDEDGRTIALRDYFGAKPVVLALVYYECPMLCNLVLNGLARTLKVTSLKMGQDFQVVAISIDPHEIPDQAIAKKKYYNRDPSGTGRGWHFLTGDEKSISAVADSVGFRYVYDAKTGQFAHASGIMILTPQGKVARYLYGIDYAPKDFRLGLVEAARGKIGSKVDQLLLLCFHYDPSTGKYSLAILTALRAAGIATVLGLGTFVFVMLRRERRQRA
jgi:protein SCO1